MITAMPSLTVCPLVGLSWDRRLQASAQFRVRRGQDIHRVTADSKVKCTTTYAGVTFTVDYLVADVPNHIYLGTNIAYTSPEATLALRRAAFNLNYSGLLSPHSKGYDTLMNHLLAITDPTTRPARKPGHLYDSILTCPYVAAPHDHHSYTTTSPDYDSEGENDHSEDNDAAPCVCATFPDPHPPPPRASSADYTPLSTEIMKKYSDVFAHSLPNKIPELDKGPTHEIHLIDPNRPMTRPSFPVPAKLSATSKRMIFIDRYS
ncbi:hypothetical protein BDK51DRAFT_39976 [Blyttiomyces helicus]|uniref:Uncharacterized protein n=1 Tax=Blyttiomyces helicus TaxID=388810 RepID=A0A4P9W0V4_9FUNG|nr:hypothetical protein BDK51DRAFT_39976 [Blyttiomyces helicus]|eukprot:RKO85262.1 hypothetical protein BDK51DRAFT_39976 [Blyttiomyces helicus]